MLNHNFVMTSLPRYKGSVANSLDGPCVNTEWGIIDDSYQRQVYKYQWVARQNNPKIKMQCSGSFYQER